MRIPFRKPTAPEGSVLIIALFISALLGITLGGYLFLVRSQNVAIARSQAWNTALALAEAGAEEALAHLNPDIAASVDRSANGWGLPVGGFYGPKIRDVQNNSYSVEFTADAYPILYSTGYVTLPASSTVLSRTVRLTTTNVPLFSLAMGAKLNINMNGNNIITDSFDSSNPSFSSNGVYTASRASTNGDVASLAGVVNVGNADVHGDLYLGAGATDNVLNNGLVTGSIYNDYNVDFADVVLPTTSWFAANPLGQPTNIDGVLYDYYFSTSGDYKIASSGNIYVAAGTYIRLKVVPANFSPAAVRVAGSGANAGNLQIYMTGTSFTLSGKSFVDGGNAANLGYWGLPSNTAITLSGNTSFVGTIYAPQALFTLGGGGGGNYDFVGAVVARSISMNGHFSFHYDENLQRAGPSRGYLVTSWREL